MKNKEKKEELKLKPPSSVAGGPQAVIKALSTSVIQMGPLRATKSLLHVNQKSGFDCPGCAWPESNEDRSAFEFCENGAKAVAEEATLKRIDEAFFKKHSLQDLSNQSDYWLSQQGRLTHPMWLSPDSKNYGPISWDEAFRVIASELKKLNTPDEAIFYTSGRTSNEAAFVYQLFVRMFGTNNLPDCSNLCHESSGVGLSEVLGSGKGTVHLLDFEKADCILVIGQNPGTNHPRMLSTLQKAARRGCKIISINPLKETGLLRFKNPQELQGWIGKGSAISTHYLQIRINGDGAVLKGIMKKILEDENKHPGAVIDHEFIQKYTVGFEAFRKNLDQCSWKEIEEGSGVTQEEIIEVANLVASSKSLICCWAMGLTQHKNAVANIQEIVNLLLLGGHLGRPGAGACPVRGHSNVQGDRTMGIWENPSQEFLRSLEKEFKFKPPHVPGFNVVKSIEAMHDGKAKVFFALGGNFASASPDTTYTEEALRKCQLSVHVSTKLNRSHVVTGKQALILPCLGRTEIDRTGERIQFVSVEDSMGMVHSSQGVLEPASTHLRSEVSIVCGLAKAVLEEKYGVFWEKLASNYDLIRDHVSRVVPGFEHYNEKIRMPGGFCLPHSVRDELNFHTASKKAHFSVHPLKLTKLEPEEFMMMTIRSHDQYNTTIYGLNDRYRGVFKGRKVIMMNTDDMKAQGFKDGDQVDITSVFEGKKRSVQGFAVIPYAIPKQCVATYFPETNGLIPVNSYADKSHTPTSKSVVVKLSVKVSPIC